MLNLPGTELTFFMAASAVLFFASVSETNHNSDLAVVEQCANYQDFVSPSSSPVPT